MSEKGEGEPVSFEGWVDLSDDMKDYLNQHLEDIGNGGMECFPKSLLLENPTNKRESQVVLAVQCGLSIEVGRQLAEGQKIRLGIGGFSSEDNGVGIPFYRLRGEDDTKTIQNINKVVARTNEVLETFDQPKIPPFTTATSRVV